MWFEVTFFERAISSSQWSALLKRIRKVSNILKCRITREEELFRFFIEADQDLTRINPEIYPHHLLSIESAPSLPKAQGKTIGIILQTLVEIYKAHLTEQFTNRLVAAELSLGAQLLPRKIDLYFEDKDKILLSSAMSFRSVSDFLGFDLKDIFEIDLVRAIPNLETPSPDQLPLGDQGFTRCIVSGGITAKESYLPLTSLDFMGKSLFCNCPNLLNSALHNLWRSEARNTTSVLAIYVGELDAPTGASSYVFDLVREIPDLDYLNRDHSGLVNLVKTTLASTCSFEVSSEPYRLLDQCLELLNRSGHMSVGNLRRVLVDAKFRADCLKNCSDEGTKRFFESEFLNLYVTPNVFQPLLDSLTLFKDPSTTLTNQNLRDSLNRNFLTVLRIPKQSDSLRAFKVAATIILAEVEACYKNSQLDHKPLILINNVSLVSSRKLSDILSTESGMAVWAGIQSPQELNYSSLENLIARNSNLFIGALDRSNAELMIAPLINHVARVFRRHIVHPRDSVEYACRLITELKGSEVIVRGVRNNKILAPFKAY